MFRSTIDPLNPNEFDERKAQHLLQRAGFGGTEQQFKTLAEMGLEKAVDYIVEFQDLPNNSPVELDAFDKELSLENLYPKKPSFTLYSSFVSLDIIFDDSSYQRNLGLILNLTPLILSLANLKLVVSKYKVFTNL